MTYPEKYTMTLTDFKKLKRGLTLEHISEKTSVVFDAELVEYLASKTAKYQSSEDLTKTIAESAKKLRQRGFNVSMCSLYADPMSGEATCHNVRVSVTRNFTSGDAS